MRSRTCKMPRYVWLFLISGIMLCACTGRDEAFCRCLEAGEELNVQSEKMLKDSSNPAERKKYHDLKRQKEKVCRSFQTMDGPTMIEKKRACEGK